MPVFVDNLALYVFFMLSYFVLIAVAFKKPYSYTYTFFSSMLFLGIVFKYMLHFFVDIRYVEPIGGFDIVTGDWSSVLVVSTVGAVALIAARLLQLKLLPLSPYDGQGITYCARFFDSHQNVFWILVSMMVVVFCLFNFHFAIYQIGVKPLLVLPYHLNVIVAFLITIVFPLVMNVLLWLSFQSKQKNAKVIGLLVFVCLAALLSLSTLSRSFFLLIVFPVGWLILSAHQSGFVLKPLPRIVALVVVLAGFSGTFVGVTFLRAEVYQLVISPVISTKIQLEHGNAFASQPTPASQPKRMFVVDTWPGLISALAGGRWIGLEGLMAVSAYPGKGSDLFISAVMERPSNGADLTFQRILGASNQYAGQDTEKYEFMSLPGPVAFSYMSGSYWIVFTFLMIVMLLMMVVEKLTELVLVNPLSTMFIAFSMAYSLMNFYSAYLFLVKLSEIIFLLLLGLVLIRIFVRKGESA